MYCNIISAEEVYQSGWSIFAPLTQQHVEALLDIATPRIAGPMAKIEDVLFHIKAPN